MHILIDYICDELKGMEAAIEKHGGLTEGEIEFADILAHLEKNLLKVESMMADRNNAGTGRRVVRRDSTTHYGGVGAEDVANSLRAMLKYVPDENVKRDMERLVERMEQMK